MASSRSEEKPAFFSFSLIDRSLNETPTVPESPRRDRQETAGSSHDVFEGVSQIVHSAVSDSDPYHLRWIAVKDRKIIEIRIFRYDGQTVFPGEFPHLHIRRLIEVFQHDMGGVGKNIYDAGKDAMGNIVVEQQSFRHCAAPVWFCVHGRRHTGAPP